MCAAATNDRVTQTEDATMTLAKLIERLTLAQDKFGGDSEVKVKQGENELEFTVKATMVLSEGSETGVATEIVIELPE
jgi:uncharacterized protein YcnI